MNVFQVKTGFSLLTGNLENGKAFFSQGILKRREKSGKITQNTGISDNVIYYF